jgi:hypothetical protein
MAKYDKHGMEGSRTYTSWCLMKQRCGNPNNDRYAAYGGKGITYDPKWAVFTGFFEDMGERPEGTSIDRIDNEGNYCKENCRWATRAEQDRNKAQTKMWTYNGKTMCQQDWAAHLGINQQTLSERDKRGWPVERILATPGRGRKS